MPSVTYEISFLPEPWDFEGKHFLLRPVAQYQSERERLLKNCVDGFLPLPTQVIIEGKGNSIEFEGHRSPAVVTCRYPYILEDFNALPRGKTVVPNSMHTSEMRRLPASHILTIKQAGEIDPKRGIGALLLHLIGFLSGSRLQFTDWWFDCRIPLAKPHSISIYKPCIPTFLDKAVQYYRHINTRSRRIALINALLLQTQAISINHEWEKFIY